MIIQKLLEYIFESEDHPFARRFAYWVNSSARFKTFVDNDRNRNKIRGKIRKAKRENDTQEADEKLRDVQFELEIAYLLLQNDCFSEVEYEKYGVGTSQSPDFTVTYETGAVFNVEVKRIREASPERRFEAWEQRIREKVCSVASTLALKIYITNWQGYATEWEPDLLDRLEEKASDIIKYIVDLIPIVEESIPIGGKAEYPVPGFESELGLEFTKPPRKRLANTLYYGADRPVFYAQGSYLKHGEYRKFGDAICNGVGQLRPNMINVLVITSSSETHEDIDLDGALVSLLERARQKDDNFFIKKGFGGVDDFLTHFSRLSGVLFRSTFRGSVPNMLWRNKEAECQHLEDIGEALQRMDYF